MAFSSVKLTKGHVLLTELGTAKNPKFQERDLEIWHAGAPDGIVLATTVPSTIPLTTDVNVATSLSVPWNCGGYQPADGTTGIMFETYIAQMRFDSLPLQLPLAPGTVDITFPLLSGSSVPWGFKGDITFTMKFTKGHGEYIGDAQLSPSIPVELYAVAADMAPTFDKGIPIDLVKLFVLPTVGQGLKNSEDWIEWVVTRCHASKADDDPKILVPMESRIHSYQYDVWNGQYQFESLYGFNINEWLAGRTNPHDITINCYDQTGLVHCALNLGLPHKLTDRDGDRDNQMITDTTSGIRQPFLNHKWVLVRILDQNQKIQEMAVDACAGPTAKPIPVKEYLKSAIDPVTVDAYAKKWPHYDLEYAKEIGPITGLKKTDVQRNRHLPVYELFKGNPSRRQSPPAMAVPMDDIAASIQAAMTLSQPGKTWTVTSPDLTIDTHGAVQDFVVCEATVQQPYLTVRVDIMSNFTEAVHKAQSRLETLSKDPANFLQIPPKDDNYCGDIYFTCTPDSHLHLMVYGNFAIQVQGRGSQHSDLQAVSAAISGYMKQFEDSSPPASLPLPISQVSTVNVGDEFLGDYIERIFTWSNENNTTFLQDPAPSSAMPGLWKIPCLASINKHQNAVEHPDGTLVDVLSITTFATSTYYPTRQEINVTIKFPLPSQ